MVKCCNKATDLDTINCYNTRTLLNKGEAAMKLNTAHEVETLDTLKNLVDAVRDLDLDSDTRRTVEFNTDTYNLISWLGESLDSIAESLKKIEAKIK